MAFWEASDGPEQETPDRGTRGSSGRGRFAAGTPEDVAALYTWANLQGARYRDFSASRKRYREQVRDQAEEAATAQQNAQERLPETPPVDGPTQTPASKTNLEQRKQGGSAIRWAAGRPGWESSSRSVAWEQTQKRVFDHPDTQHAVGAAALKQESRREIAAGFQPAARGREPTLSHNFDEVTEQRPGPGWNTEREFAPTNHAAGENASVADDPMYRGSANALGQQRWDPINPDPAEVDRAVADTLRAVHPETRPASGATAVWMAEPDDEPEFDAPAWLYTAPAAAVRSRASAEKEAEQPIRGSTHHGERRNHLREVAEDDRAGTREPRTPTPAGRKAAMLVVFSIAGGVGRTSLLATVARALSAGGERVVLGDAAPFSLLPFFFGGQELDRGELRGFAPPADSLDAPILMVNYDLQRAAHDMGEQKHMVGEILRSGAECHRILLDIPYGSEWLLRRLATLEPTVLVPLLPDMCSVLSLELVERYFDQIEDEDGNPVRPFYVLNQYEASQKLHRDVRDLLAARLGERLLKFVVRRSTAVAEALAEGMTVADYVPESAVTRDYFDLAAWVRTVSPPAARAARLAHSGPRSGNG